MSSTADDKQWLLPGPGADGQVPVAGGALCSFCCCNMFFLALVALSVSVGVVIGPPWVALAVGCLFLSIVVALLVIWFCALQSFQLWALQRPGNLISRLILPIIEVVEGLKDVAPYYEELRKKWGNTFPVAGMVCLGDWSAIERALTKPQARTHNLGSHPLIESHLPHSSRDPSRILFLLSISNRGAGGNGDHEAFRACMDKYVFNSAAEERREDATSKGLLGQLARDYADMPHGIGETFYHDKERGLTPFLVKFLHYALFGISPTKKEAIKALIDWHSGEKNLSHYLSPFGHLINKQSTIDKVVKIYEDCPAFANFKEGGAEFNGMTRQDLSLLMLTIMRIAGVQGTHLLCMIVMGGVNFPAYPGTDVFHTDVTKLWDTLKLDDREEVKKYVLECARIAPPVTTSHMVAQEDIKVSIAGKMYWFPMGTKVLVPLCMGMVDPAIWGNDVYELKPNRPNLCPFHMGFNAVGERTNGRICPGQSTALHTVVDLLIVVGKQRTGK